MSGGTRGGGGGGEGSAPSTANNNNASDMVLIEDRHQNTNLGGNLWLLKQQDYFTDLALLGSDNEQVKGHLCVIAVASPLVKNHAVDGSEPQRRLEGRVAIPVPNFRAAVIEHFVTFAYRGQVNIPSDMVRDLYNLADYFMDVALQQAITNTVGSIPANIPNIAEVLTKNEEYKPSEKEQEELDAIMFKKTGRRKGRLPKKNHVKKEGSAEPVGGTPEETQENGVPSTSTGYPVQMTRIKRKSAVDATAKLKKVSARIVAADMDSGDVDDLPEPDDDDDDDDDHMDDDNDVELTTYTPPRRRLLKRKAKSAVGRKRGGGSAAAAKRSYTPASERTTTTPSTTTNNTGSGRPRRARKTSIETDKEKEKVVPAQRNNIDQPELEWVDGKPSTMCKRCDRTICLHRSTMISPEELDYHIKEEGGMVIDAPVPSEGTIGTLTAVTGAEGGDGMDESGDFNNTADPGRGGRESDGIDALLSLGRGEGAATAAAAAAADQDNNEEGTVISKAGLKKEEVDKKEEGEEEDGEDSKEVGNNEKEEGEEEDDSNTPLPKSPTACPLRTKYKLWVDPDTKKTRKLFPCEFCGNLYLTLPRLLKHISTHTGIYPFNCPLCSGEFKTKDEMTKHDRRKHRGTASTGFPGAQFQCQQCAVAYHKRDALERHVKNHNNDSRQPRANYVLKRKPESNRLVRTYPCPHCALEFNKASEFEGHLSSHTGIKLYTCRLCNKRFGNEGYLKKHMLRHVEEKSYICALCGSAFKTSSGLYTHEHSVHIETKPFVCEVCGKEFKMKWSMKEHIRMAHSDYVLPKGQTSNWQCSYCGGFLPSEIMFRIHEKLHITDKPFKCRRCSASFKYRAARLSHERREHEGVQQDPRLVMPRTPSSKSKKEKEPLPPLSEHSVPSVADAVAAAAQAAVAGSSSTMRYMDEGGAGGALSSSYLDNIYYPQQVSQHPLPPAQSFIHHHQLQQQQLQHHHQQQQQQQQQHHQHHQHHHHQQLPSPQQTHSREGTPLRQQNQQAPPPTSSVVSLHMQLPPQYTPSHTPTPSETYHHDSRVSTPNQFSHPDPSSTPTPQEHHTLQQLPVYSSAHILPAAAAAASVLYDPSYFMSTAGASPHMSQALAPPPPQSSTPLLVSAAATAAAAPLPSHIHHIYAQAPIPTPSQQQQQQQHPPPLPSPSPGVTTSNSSSHSQDLHAHAAPLPSSHHHIIHAHTVPTTNTNTADNSNNNHNRSTPQPPPPPPPNGQSQQSAAAPPPPPTQASLQAQLAANACTICNLAFESHQQLWNHMTVMHNIIMTGM